MKIQKEIIEFEKGKSFKLFSPSLKNCFFWHYHPEIELVYVEAVNGIRHVGKNISGFTDSDLLLIGSNVPHLNFDYGIQTECRQLVLQMRESFLQDIILPVPEFENIKNLLERSYLGLSFSGETKNTVVEKLQAIKDKNSFESLVGLIEILQILAHSTEVKELNKEDTRIKWFLNDKIRMGTIYDYIHENYDRKPNVNEVAQVVSLSTPAFCRYFKKQTNMTFTDFVNNYRINQAKIFLLKDQSVTEVCFQVGFESLSYFNKLFKQHTGETPSEFKKKHFRPIEINGRIGVIKKDTTC
ncbi:MULTISPECIES: AraC family transcriptional regulator [Chryseobacterium]|uniref:AraC family transcriptional regulator n=1 Tax=Chryseobacterium cucumeris TaxID=1813611 RepID=A0ABX9XAL9_9FLAO|nr:MULTISPECIES: AraC family transcriptional regulator [Chryseobacterium]KYH03781.1 AraC family transcriptional regulator [Chryseobacterium cucumeris]MDH5034470.1 AraC family transcriptional regulator [Chryseobacterium cucumeris]QWT87865.1 helix-turn-helix domain-containing protein [Chryseobacterium sp. PCH239]ROH95332.1 AraC family transcriptional regulator [Chryseobacterium cucumeris]WFB67344.1 AraC family transcriptional regulator [Chryseobacterium sp. WX]